MCGIAGLLDTNRGVDRSVLEAMTDALLHRGPDGRGFWLDKEIGLGHRRLAILDLSPTGAQPMTSASGRWVVAFNGEIYNYLDLRREMPGEKFLGSSDTEVMLHLMDRYGLENTLGKMAGMFAIAAWDNQERALWLARDRLGEKPLYWAPTPGGLCFASEPKALRKNPALSFRPHLPALRTFLDLGYVPAPFSSWEGIHQLRPGHWIRWKDGCVSEPKAFWHLPLGGVPSSLDEVEETLVRCVKQQMLSDVPLGAFLSGGIDSSLVTALMAENHPGRIRTFSIGFSEPGYNEAPSARAVAEHLGTDHTDLTATPKDALDLVPKIPEIWDEPFADSSQIPTLLLAKLTRRHVTVALSGDGGDEVFAGYNRHVEAPGMWAALSRTPLPARRLAAAALRMVPDPLAGALFALLRPGTPQPVEKFHKFARAAGCRSLLDLYQSLTLTGERGAALLPGIAPLPRHAAAGGEDLLQRLDLGEYLPGDILVKVDRAAMASSLETRAPYLDHRVVEVALRLPAHLRTHGGQGKIALRTLLARRVPEKLFQRPKTGFAVPLHAWLRGPLRSWGSDLVSTAGKHAWIHESEARSLWQRVLSGDARQVHQAWALLMLLSWLEKESR